jgi:hypothetical protein
MPRQHTLDTLVDDVAQWIEDTADFLAESMLEDGVAPFEARLTEQQRLDYFTRLLFNDDGTPNQGGRQQLLQSQGLDEYVRTFRWVETRRNREIRGTSKREPARRSAPSEDYEDI